MTVLFSAVNVYSYRRNNGFMNARPLQGFTFNEYFKIEYSALNGETVYVFLGFKHRYTVTTTPTEGGDGPLGELVNPPKSPGPQRLRLLSRM